MRVTWAIDIENKNTGITSSLSKFYKPKVRKGFGSVKDSFSFSVDNFNGRFDNYFNIGDIVYIYRSVNAAINKSTDLLMTGKVKSFPSTYSANGVTIVVSGVNYTEALLNALIFADTEGLSLDAALKAGLESIGLIDPNFPVTWDTSNPITTSTGDPFPTVYEPWFYVPFTRMAEKYSSNAFTDDGNYYWYITKDSKFSWGKITDASSGTFDSTTSSYQSLKVDYDDNEVHNWLVVKGGTTPDGKPIQTNVSDPASINRHGFRPYFYVEAAGYSAIINDKDLKIATGHTDGRFPDFTYYSGGFTCAWVATVSDSTVTPALVKGDYPTVTSKTQYENIIKRESLNYITKQANQYLDIRGNGTIKASITTKPTINWSIGSLISVTIPEQGFENTTMRVIDITYGEFYDLYVLEEDIGTITGDT